MQPTRRGTDSEVDEAIERGAAAGRRFAKGCLLIGLPLLFGLSCLGGSAVYGYLALFADATVHVHHARGQAAVYVDDERVGSLTSPGVTTFDVPRGTHQLRVEGEDDPEAQIDRDFLGFDHLLISTDPGVCFVQLNVNRAFYGPGDEPVRQGPRCNFDADDLDVYWVCTETPCEIGGSDVRIADLPESVEGMSPVTLMVPFACAEAETLDAAGALARMVGCIPR